MTNDVEYLFMCLLVLAHFFFFFFKTTNNFAFICIYFLRHLFPGHKFLFLQFLLGYLFLLCNLLFWFRNSLFFFISVWLGELMYGLIQPWDLLVLCPILGTLFTWMCSMTRESTSKPLRSALLFTFLHMCRKNLSFFLGHRPSIQPYCWAYAHLPTPPL